MTTPRTDSEYDKLAADAEAAAARCTDEHERRVHEEVARLWRDLAEQRRMRDALKARS